MIPGKSRRKKRKRVKLFVMNAKVLKKRKKPPTFSPFTREKVMKLALVVTVVGGCGFGGFGVGRHFLAAPEYGIRHILVRGAEVLSRERIISLSMLRKGENIFRSRIYRARKRLLKLPLLEHAAITRFKPDTIVIDIVERRPRAQVAGSRKFLIDYSGVLLSRSSCADADNLHLIMGVDTGDLCVGEKCSQSGIGKAMQVLALYQSSPLAEMVQVAGIDASRPEDVRLYLKQSRYTRRGSEFVIGEGNFGEKLAKLEVILRSSVQRHNMKLTSADLTLGNVPVRF